MRLLERFANVGCCIACCLDKETDFRVGAVNASVKERKQKRNLIMRMPRAAHLQASALSFMWIAGILQ
jgi:hypothetical protein